MDIIPDFPDASRWNDYVERHPEGRFCHRFEYRCIQSVYGYTPFYVALLKEGEIVGVLPAFAARSVIFGRKLVSQPFSEYGGPLLDGTVSSNDMRLSVDWMRGFLAEHKIAALEMHGCRGMPDGHRRDFVPMHEHQAAQLDLGDSLDEIWNRVISYDVRKAVKKAERAGLTVEERSDPETIRRDFYPLYLGSMKRLGAPAHSVDYYLACKLAFGTAMKIFWSKNGDALLAGLLGFTCGHRVNIVNTVSDERYWHLRPNDLVHWEFIKWAHGAGYTCFDFGSVRYEGQSRYKKKWGCTFDGHAYYFLAARNNGVRLRTFDSSSGTMKGFARLWSAHVPAPVAQRLGPCLRKHLVR
jgi:CelD/BcsL family acetyltransferase involved in cellulose biosynthesis